MTAGFITVSLLGVFTFLLIGVGGFVVIDRKLNTNDYIYITISNFKSVCTSVSISLWHPVPPEICQSPDILIFSLQRCPLLPSWAEGLESIHAVGTFQCRKYFWKLLIHSNQKISDCITLFEVSYYRVFNLKVNYFNPMLQSSF